MQFKMYNAAIKGVNKKGDKQWIRFKIDGLPQFKVSVAGQGVLKAQL